MQQDVDYNDTFSPTLGSTATRTIISIATAEDLEPQSVDFAQILIQAVACQKVSMANSSSRPIQPLHTPTPPV